MRKFVSVVVLMFVTMSFGVPAFADSKGSDGGTTTNDVIVKNIESGAANFSAGPASAMDITHHEMSKSNTVGGQMLGLGVGGVKVARKTLHHAGAGVIDILTFWIPKKEPLIGSEKPGLE